MRVEIVLNQDDLVRIGVGSGELLHESGIILLGLTFGDPNDTPPRQRLDCHQDDTGPVTFVMIVLFFDLAGLHGKRH